MKWERTREKTRRWRFVEGTAVQPAISVYRRFDTVNDIPHGCMEYTYTIGRGWSYRLNISCDEIYTPEDIVDIICHELHHWASTLFVEEEDVRRGALSMFRGKTARTPRQYGEYLMEKYADWFPHSGRVLDRDFDTHEEQERAYYKNVRKI